jgi:preprotein translocase subunit SecY
MARTPGLEKAKSGMSELTQRLIFVVLALVVFRIGSHIPCPGINAQRLAQVMEEQKGTIIGMFNMFSGGALSRASLFALGIMPYISSAIIVQLLGVMVPSIQELKKEGEAGRRKITQMTRWGTLILGAVQAFGIATGLPNMIQGIVIDPGFSFYFTTTISLLTGTMFLMWLGEQITERGVGNGISLIIFAGIVAGFPGAIGSTFEQFKQEGSSYVFVLLGIVFMVVAVTTFVVFMERALRKITVHYPRQQQVGRMYAPPTSHLPLKINQSGVIPAIFASSIIMFPATVASWFGQGDSAFARFVSNISQILQPGQPLYEMLYAFAIVFFCFFYTSLVFNPKELAENLKKSGAFISGILPGEHTARFIDQVMTRLTLVGSLYMVLVCLIPQFMLSFLNVQFYFGGTSLLIVVVVVMDFTSQLMAHRVSHQYADVMRKQNLKFTNR